MEPPLIDVFLIGVFVSFLAGFGVTGGVHRYWTHKTYKANIPLRIILMLCFGVAGQVRINKFKIQSSHFIQSYLCAYSYRIISPRVIGKIYYVFELLVLKNLHNQKSRKTITAVFDWNGISPAEGAIKYDFSRGCSQF